jgi:hypothetical protein
VKQRSFILFLVLSGLSVAHSLVPTLAQDKKPGYAFHFERIIEKGQRWKLKYQESSSKQLTIGGRKREARTAKIAFEAEVLAKGSGKNPQEELEVKISKLSGKELWRGRKAKLVLVKKGPQLEKKWSELKGAPLPWLKQIFASGIPEAMSKVFLPGMSIKNSIKANFSWDLSRKKWAQLFAREPGLGGDLSSAEKLVNFKGKGLIRSISKSGRAQFLIELSYQPGQLGERAFKAGSSYKLSLAGWVELGLPGRPFEVTMKSELEGELEGSAENKAGIQICYRQLRVLKRLQ